MAYRLLIAVFMPKDTDSKSLILKAFILLGDTELSGFRHFCLDLDTFDDFLTGKACSVPVWDTKTGGDATSRGILILILGSWC